MEYEHIFIDVGNVLFHDWAVEMVYSYLVFKGLNPDGKNNFWQRRYRELQKGNMDWVVTLCREHDPENEPYLIHSAWKFVLDHWNEINVPIEHAISALFRLSHHTNVSIAANQPSVTRELLKKYNIESCVKHIILDDEIGIRKPEQAFFEKLVDLSQLPAEKVLYIGDRIENDILPARKIGMGAAWLEYSPSFTNIKYVPVPWQKRFFESYSIIGGYNICKELYSADLSNVGRYKDLYTFCNCIIPD